MPSLFYAETVLNTNLITNLTDRDNEFLLMKLRGTQKWEETHQIEHYFKLQQLGT